MEKFVCVRMVQANTMDLSRFQFNYDLTFAAFFMNADGTFYGRYGTRSSQKEAEKDISVEGFADALTGAIVLHDKYPANERFLAGKQPKPVAYKTPDDFPELRGKYKDTLDYKGQVTKSCLHCHQVGEQFRHVHRNAGKPIPDRELFSYPMPEVVGLTLDAKTRATVKEVNAESSAAKAGFQVGDVLLTLDGQAVLSIADVQWVLHNTADQASLPAVINRGGKRFQLRLELPEGWRRATDISWRATSWDLRRIGTGGMKLEAMTKAEAEAAGLEPSKMALKAEHVGQYGAHAVAKQAGFKKGDILTSFDGRNDLMTDSQLLAYSAQNTKPGQTVPVVVRRGDKQLTLDLKMQ
jgi:serine protease Do